MSQQVPFLTISNTIQNIELMGQLIRLMDNYPKGKLFKPRKILSDTKTILYKSSLEKAGSDNANIFEVPHLCFVCVSWVYLFEKIIDIIFYSKQ